MKTEKTYIVITRFAGHDKNIMVLLVNSIEEALKEAQNDLKQNFVDSVEVYEAGKAQYCYFGRKIFKCNK